MFIQTESTPNPATMKFLPGQTVMEAGTAEFTNPEAANRSPLAARLFEIAGVRSVFYGSDFISVSIDGGDWAHVKPGILGAIMDHYTAGGPLITGEAEETEAAIAEEDVEIVEQIKELIETRVRPAVAMDGGDIIFHKFDAGTVYLHMRGACAGCPASTMTLKHGIENMLRHYVPEVEEVVAVD